MAKPIPGQLNVPVPNEIGAQHNPDAAYEQTFGSEKSPRAAGASRGVERLQLRPEAKPSRARMPEGEAEPLSPALEVSVYGVPQPAGATMKEDT